MYSCLATCSKLPRAIGQLPLSAWAEARERRPGRLHRHLNLEHGTGAARRYEWPSPRSHRSHISGLELCRCLMRRKTGWAGTVVNGAFFYSLGRGGDVYHRVYPLREVA